jgi:DNA-binding NtrC family response regulator
MRASLTILLIDNDAQQSAMIDQIIRNRLGFHAIIKKDVQATLQALNAYELEADVILIDISFANAKNLDWLPKLHNAHPHIPLIVFTGYGDSDQVEKALRAGACDYLAKPVSHLRLKTSILNACKLRLLSRELNALRTANPAKASGHATIEVTGFQKVELRKPESKRLLISGPAGCGKKHFAALFHRLHGQGEMEIVASSTLSMQGGAASLKQELHYLCQRLGEGTLVLDEIAALPPGEQQVLREFMCMEPQTRFVFITRRNLAEEVMQRRFDKDLQTLICKEMIVMPKLEGRDQDIAALATHFCIAFALQEQKSIFGISPEAMKWLCQYSWPGNIRQLKQALHRAVILCDSTHLQPQHFHPLISRHSVPSSRMGSNNTFATHLTRHVPLCRDDGNIRTLQELESDLIYFAIEHYNGRMTEAARRLGIGRSTLYRKVTDFNIPIPAEA